VTLIEQIRKHVVEEGDCWNWTGALQGCGTVPTMNYKRKVGAVRRFILQEQGVDLDKGKRLATYTCGNTMCVNPEHTAPATRRAVQRRTTEELGHQKSLLRRKKLADNARKRAKLNPELARQVREADGTQDEIAERFGISQATVSAIKRGVTWKDYNNPFAGLAL
jgi:predicted XRE-type DNA-binding protein